MNDREQDQNPPLPGGSYTGGGAMEHDETIDGSGTDRSGDEVGVPSVDDETEHADETIATEPDGGITREQ